MHESPATAVLSLDKGNEIVGLSHGLERLLGWPADELLGAPVAKILAAPTTGRAAIPDSGEPAAMTGLRPDGDTLRLRVAAQDWETEGGHFVTLSITPAEAVPTEDADAYAKARSAEERFDALLDASPDGIVVTDSEGRVEIFNAAAERLFGYSEAEFTGRDLLDLLPGLTRDVTDTQ